MQRFEPLVVAFQPVEDVQQGQGAEPAHGRLHCRGRRGDKVIQHVAGVDVDVVVIGDAPLERHGPLRHGGVIDSRREIRTRNKVKTIQVLSKKM